MSNGDVVGVLRRIVPQGVHTAEIVDQGQAVFLREAEQGAVAGAGARRVRDFTLGRDCAHRALRDLGADTDEILCNDNGAPLWPEGIRGSITHTQGYAAAAVVPGQLAAGIGIDAEGVQEFATNVASRIFGPDEHSYLNALSKEKRAVAATTLFSAKEAYFKACPRSAGAYRFRETRVELKDGAFLVGVEGNSLTGGWTVWNGLVITAIVVPLA